MNCIYHNNKQADCFCDNCRQPICRTCFNSLGGYCVRCQKQLNSEIIKRDIITLVLFVIFGIWGVVIALDSADMSVIERIVMVICVSAIPLGWRGLNKITPNIFLILPLVGWLIYYFVKAVLSVLIGWILFIPQVIKIIKDFTDVRKTKEIIANL